MFISTTIRRLCPQLFFFFFVPTEEQLREMSRSRLVLIVSDNGQNNIFKRVISLVYGGPGVRVLLPSCVRQGRGLNLFQPAPYITNHGMYQCFKHLRRVHRVQVGLLSSETTAATPGPPAQARVVGV